MTKYYKEFQLSKVDNPKRLLVHCRSGLGRTGTTLCALNLLIQHRLQCDNLKSQGIVPSR